jgi:ectoine hydroxylase-related dioxygenase (phytanoyl-CoA dioxygenase family)/alkylated DNA repair dioxygenase AlkB
MEDVEYYQKHGAVVLRNVISSYELTLLREGIETVLQNPSVRAIVATTNDDDNTTRQFFEDFNRWVDIPSLRTFITGTRLSRIGAQLMQSRTSTLFHDHILVKEQGTTTKTPYHQDQPYYDIAGSQTISFWIPVEAVDEKTCLQLIDGSHIGGQWYCPRSFTTGEAKWFPPGTLPEFVIEDHTDSPVLRWTLQPGDCIAFHHLTVHGACGVSSTHPRRPVYSLRLVGDDVTYEPRNWIPSPDLGPMLMSTLGYDPRQAGMPLSGPIFPTLFTCPVNLEAYPLIGSDASVKAELVSRLRAEYLVKGAVVLPHFLSADALRIMLEEVQSTLNMTYISQDGHNVYLDGGDPTLPIDHPRNVHVRTVVGSIAYDLLPEHSLLRKLYAYEPLLDLVRGVLGLTTLYRNADDIGCCTINVFRPGDEQGFHYDETMFSVTLMLTEDEGGGGLFDYFPNLRTRENGNLDEEYRAIQQALEGSTKGIVNLPIQPGSLAIFNGHNALHRVSMVESKIRLVAVLAFNEEADVKNSEEVRELFWGRRVASPRDDVP